MVVDVNDDVFFLVSEYVLSYGECYGEDLEVVEKW